MPWKEGNVECKGFNLKTAWLGRACPNIPEVVFGVGGGGHEVDKGVFQPEEWQVPGA